MRITEATGYGRIYKVRLSRAVAFGSGSLPSGVSLNTPKTGILRIEMKDGSAQKFDLSRVGQVLIKHPRKPQ